MGIAIDSYKNATGNVKLRRMSTPTNLAPTIIRSRAGRYSC